MEQKLDKRDEIIPGKEEPQNTPPDIEAIIQS